MLEVGHLPIADGRFIAQSRQQAPESLGQTGDHGVLRGASFESLGYRMKAEASIGSDANLANVRRHVGKAGIQQFHTPIPGSGVPGAEFGVPEIRRIGFDTQQGIVGSLTAVAGIVADLGAGLGVRRPSPP